MKISEVFEFLILAYTKTENSQISESFLFSETQDPETKKWPKTKKL